MAVSCLVWMLAMEPGFLVTAASTVSTELTIYPSSLELITGIFKEMKMVCELAFEGLNIMHLGSSIPE